MSKVKRWRVCYENGEVIVAPNQAAAFALMYWHNHAGERADRATMESFDVDEHDEAHDVSPGNIDNFFNVMEWLIQWCDNELLRLVTPEVVNALGRQIVELGAEVSRLQDLHADAIKHNNELLEENRRLMRQESEVASAAG